MITACVALALLASTLPPHAKDVRKGTAPTAIFRAEDAAGERVPELVSAGAATAGFVGGALLAAPTLFSVLPLGGPLIAAPVAIAILGVGAGFGGFLGTLLEARLLPSLGAGAVAAGLAILGAGAGVGLSALALGACHGGGDGATIFFVASVLSAVGGIAGAAAGGALGVWLIRSAEPAQPIRGPLAESMPTSPPPLPPAPAA